MAPTIGDRLYGYISISELERRLLAQPEALRLHRVLQNSSVYHTYVNNRGSRFPHSVGAMHLAGRLYQSIAARLAAHDRTVLDNALKDLMRQIKVKEKAIKTCLEPLDPLYGEHGWTKDDWQDIVRFQGVRLAAMVHDIGHPPYSHVVEYALRDADAAFIGHATDLCSNVTTLFGEYGKLTGITGPRPDIHEMVGILITERIFGRLITEHPPTEAFVRLVVRISATILAADQLGHWNSGKAGTQDEKTVERLVPWYVLGQLVSGEVDCDRLDYLRRDPRNSGVADMGHIDVDRIIRHARVEQQTVSIHQRDVTLRVPAFDHRAVSALEQFFYERFRQFRWLVCHHNVVRTDTALSRTIYHLIDIAHRPAPEGSVYELLKSRSFEHLWRWNDDNVQFAAIDDGWLEQLLFAIHRHLDGNPNPTEQEAEILLLLNVFLYRKKERLPSLWKRLDEYTEFARGAWQYFRTRYSRSAPPKWPWLPTHPDYAAMQDLWHQMEAREDPVRFTNELIRPLKRLGAKHGLLSRLLQIERNVCKNRYLFVVKPFSAYKGLHVGKRDLGEFSSLVRNIPLMWNEGVTIFAFDRRPGEPVTQREEIGGYFAEALDMHLKSEPDKST